MTNSENLRPRIEEDENEVDDVDGVDRATVDDVERIIQFLQALDLQVLGACRADERLKPLLKLNVSCDVAEDRLLAHLSQHFEPSEVGMLARCLCIPLVAIRVGKISKEGTLLCPMAIRGNLNLTLLPTSDLRVSFTGDDGRTERLLTFYSNSQCPDIEVEEIAADKSGRSFLIRGADGEVFYFWCSEKSKLLGNELLLKMKDLLKRKPSLAELTGISESRLDCFGTYLRAYLGSSVPTKRARPISLPPCTSTNSSEFCQAAQTLSSLSSKPLRSRIVNQSYQVSLSPRSSPFKEGFSKNHSFLRNVGREKLRRRDNQYAVSDSLSVASPVKTDASSSSHPQNCKAKDATEKQELTAPSLDSLGNMNLPQFLDPVSQVTSLASSLFSPYYCWCPPIGSTLQYTVSPLQLPLSSTESFSLPPLSSLLPVIKSSNVLTPPLDLPNMTNLDFPPLLPLSRSSSPQIATFTPLMCDPIVHIPVIDVCSSGQGYLVSAGSAMSTAIAPLRPNFVNSLISEPDSVIEDGARETLRLLINGSSQNNSQLIDALPSVFTVSDERPSILATGSRGLYTGLNDVGDIFSSGIRGPYTGMSDVGVIASRIANLELVSLSENSIDGDSRGNSSMNEVEKLPGVGNDDSLSFLRENHDRIDE